MFCNMVLYGSRFSSILIQTILLFTLFYTLESKKCNLDDITCTTRLASIQHSNLISGIKNAVATSDPLSRDIIKGYLPSVKYTFYNATFNGLKQCTVTKLHIQKEKKFFQYNLECPEINVMAMYKLRGKIRNFSITGNGPAHIICGDYVLNFDCEYETYVGKDNKKHVQITDYLLEVIPRGSVVLDFQNISAGDKKQTDEFHKFIAKYWKSMDEELRAPAINSFMDLFINTINDFLKTMDVDELLDDLP